MPPTNLCSDHGKEFENNLVHDLCSQFNVNQKFGFPYHPQLQGAVEAFNKTIHKNLIKSIVTSPKKEYSKLEIETIVSRFISEYNTTIHTSTKFRPIDLIHLDPKNAQDQEKMNQAKKNMGSSFKKIEITDMEQGDLCLMANKFGKGKVKGQLVTSKARKKGQFKEYRIPVTVKEIIGPNVQVQIEKEEKTLGLKKGEKYIVEYLLLKKVKEDIWRKMLNFSQEEEDNVSAEMLSERGYDEFSQIEDESRDDNQDACEEEEARNSDEEFEELYQEGEELLNKNLEEHAEFSQIEDKSRDENQDACEEKEARNSDEEFEELYQEVEELLNKNLEEPIEPQEKEEVCLEEDDKSPVIPNKNPRGRLKKLKEIKEKKAEDDKESEDIRGNDESEEAEEEKQSIPVREQRKPSLLSAEDIEYEQMLQKEWEAEREKVWAKDQDWVPEGKKPKKKKKF